MAYRLLIANSNTTTAVTDRLVFAAREIATSGLTVEGATAGFGTAAIQSDDEVRIASDATLEILDQRKGTYDAAIIACFADPGLEKARVRYAVPVLGLGHASLLTATVFAGRVAVLTAAGGAAALTRSLIARYGLASSVPCVLEVPGPLQDLGPARVAQFEAIKGVITDAVRDHRIRGVLLGGAFFAGLAGMIRSPVPIFDPIALAVGCVELCLRTGSRAAEEPSNSLITSGTR